MILLTKTFSGYVTLFVFLGMLGFGLVCLLINLIFGSRCPKCKNRGVRKTSETCMGDYNSSTSNQYFVIYKCNKCDYYMIDYETRSSS